MPRDDENFVRKEAGKRNLCGGRGGPLRTRVSALGWIPSLPAPAICASRTKGGCSLLCQTANRG